MMLLNFIALSVGVSFDMFLPKKIINQMLVYKYKVTEEFWSWRGIIEIIAVEYVGVVESEGKTVARVNIGARPRAPVSALAPF